MSFRLGPLELILVLIVVASICIPIFVIWKLVKHFSRKQNNSGGSPLEIAEKRYASGEISKQELEEIKQTISG